MTAIFSCVIVVAEWIGLHPAQDEILPELKRCGDDWCVVESISKKTTWDKAEVFCKRYICHIELSDARQPLLASWLLYYGKPCGVSIDPFGHATLLYRSIALNLGEFSATGKSEFAIDMPIYSIWIYAHERNLCTENVSGWHTVPWKGFMSPYRYRQLTG